MIVGIIQRKPVLTHAMVCGGMLASVNSVNIKMQNVTRMWANAQPDGRPAEHRWRPLFNAAKFS